MFTSVGGCVYFSRLFYVARFFSIALSFGE